MKKFGFVEIVASAKKFMISERRTAYEHVAVDEAVLGKRHEPLEA